MKLKFGMVGGGNGAFIAKFHRQGAIMDDMAGWLPAAFRAAGRKMCSARRNGGCAIGRVSIMTSRKWRAWRARVRIR